MVNKKKTYLTPSLSVIYIEMESVLCASADSPFEAKDVNFDDYYKNAFGSYEN